MASISNPYLSQRFRTLIWSCLDFNLLKTGTFYAERYFYVDQDNHEARHLYATALLRSGQTQSALYLVDLPQETRCSACVELESTVVADEAVLRCRAGVLALKTNLQEKAALHFSRALLLNPLLWEAFEGLCSSGVYPELDELFPPRSKQTKSDDTSISYWYDRKNGPVNTGIGFFSPETHMPGSGSRTWLTQPFRMDSIARESIATNESSLISADNSLVGYGTTHVRALSLPTRTVNLMPSNGRQFDEGGPIMKKARGTKLENYGWKDPLVTSQSNNTVKHPPQRKRPHHRARSNSGGSEMDDDMIAESPNSPSVSSLAQSPRSDTSPAPSNATANQEQMTQEAIEFEAADNYIYELMKMFAKAVQKLARYECQAAIEDLDRLPEEQQKSPLVMVLVGRAQYESNQYQKAERVFDEVRKQDPYRIWDMETYSSLLWQLQRTVKLSFLAQELISIDSRSAQAWIAVGNCFSLQKERTQALTCFRRATQLEPQCAYAYTLSGHECIDDDMEKAISFFQSALRADSRHYNAWYGLGTCYLRMSKLRLAEFHFRKAIEIHPNSAVLLGCVGMVMEKRGRMEQAFGLFDKAVQISSDNVLVRYRRAKLLIGMRRYSAAIEDLKKLRDLVPEEANVVFQLARAYRLKGQTPEAQQILLVARDIAPKDMNKLKKLMDIKKDKEAPEDDDTGGGMEEG
ncbi:hypothetical protein Clacol_006442 [Clathrus columnatus]|uniref:TPR-like protein n=1 Tax=Clathrus columnatus TaxID=1419009 RepID=A0AAV5AI90_9AGAM|nr:hypothetical protein Clacol_006442 [Clathrus columnatus]